MRQPPPISMNICSELNISHHTHLNSGSAIYEPLRFGSWRFIEPNVLFCQNMRAYPVDCVLLVTTLRLAALRISLSSVATIWVNLGRRFLSFTQQSSMS